MIPLRSTVPTRSAAVATIFLIALNVLVFFYELSQSPVGREVMFVHYGVIADRIHWETLITSTFLHSGWWHLIGNMWFLWIYGRNIEDLFGPFKFVAFYLYCGIASGLIQVAADAHSVTPTIGASGAIAGVMGAYLMKLPHAKIITLVFFGFVFTLEIPAWLPLVYWFGIQFFNGIGSLESRQMGNHVAWFAHIGGFISGVVVSRLLKTRNNS